MAKPLSPAEVEPYLNKVKKYCALFRSKLIPEIFEHLVRAELAEESLDQEELLERVYQNEKNMPGVSNVGRAVGELDKKLKKYYSEEGAEDAVIFKYQPRKTRIEIHSRQRAVEERVSSIEERFKRAKCYYVGNDQAGIEYLIEQMPNLSVLRDTHVRPREGYDKFKPETLKKFQQSLTDFLGRSSENRLNLIVGHGEMVDEKYLQIFSAIPDDQKDQACCRRLRFPGSFLNFIILDYVDEQVQRTIMFGWGRQGNEPREAVFLSQDRKLVEQFEELYGALSNPAISEVIDDLTEFSPERVRQVVSLRQADTLHVFHSFADTSILEEMGRCKRLRFITTGLSAMFKWFSPMRQALENGARVEIILSHPECDFIRLRGAVLGSDISAMGRTNREALRKLNGAGDLNVRLTSEVLSTSYIQLDEMIYFTMFWNYFNTFDGPMLLTHESSETGKFLANQFNELRRMAQEDDLSVDVPEPDSYHKRFHSRASE